jgi:FKBP-type peptidyl-prolyl cis-trans isomerase
MKPYKIVIFILIVIGSLWAGKAYDNTMDVQAKTAQIEEQQKAQSSIAAIMAKLKIEDIKVGSGTGAIAGDTLSVNYTGTLDNGTVFDSSYKRKVPFEFQLGAGKVIQGWDLGLVGMKIGGTRKLIIPPELGYGGTAAGNGLIPASSTLTFVIVLESIKK